MQPNVYMQESHPCPQNYVLPPLPLTRLHGISGPVQGHQSAGSDRKSTIVSREVNSLKDLTPDKPTTHFDSFLRLPSAIL
jgi:hypothetical protein